MNPGRFFVPNMNMVPYMRSGMNPFITSNMIVPRANMLGRIANGIKSFNFKGFLNGANKTLNVVNQTIPLIKEIKPIAGNMRSMVRLVRAFGNETKGVKNNVVQINSNKKGNDSKSVSTDTPTFFV